MMGQTNDGVTCFKLVGVIVLLLIALFPFDSKSSDRSLFIEQIGDDNISHVQQTGATNAAAVTQTTTANRAVLAQGDVPAADTVANVLGPEANAASFSFSMTGASGIESDSIADLIASLPSGGGGANTATLNQSGSGNRAIAVQVGGSNNRMLTQQSGNDNIGVHLQEGSNNDTALIQENGNNVNALVARGDVSGADGGPLTLHALGDVQGFSIEATGPQPHSSYTVAPNGSGGLNIQVQ